MGTHRVLIIAFISLPYADQEATALYLLAFRMKLQKIKQLWLCSPPSTENTMLVNFIPALLQVCCVQKVPVPSLIFARIRNGGEVVVVERGWRRKNLSQSIALPQTPSQHITEFDLSNI